MCAPGLQSHAPCYGFWLQVSGFMCLHVTKVCFEFGRRARAPEILADASEVLNERYKDVSCVRLGTSWVV